MIIVTGGAGFIGSNIINELNKDGYKEILAVDNLIDGKKFFNLADLHISDYQDQSDFLCDILQNNLKFKKIEAVFHQGACSATTEWNGKFMMKNNYEYSKILLDYCIQHKIPFFYASSAATYGNNTVFKEERAYEQPVNVYGYSKMLFDEYVRKTISNTKNQIVGFKYFNVYGPREQHKGSMASVAFHHYQQLKKSGTVKLFGEYGGYDAGEQKRDFVYVEDVAKVNVWFMKKSKVSGIFNLGTGRAQPFNDIANAIIKKFKNKQHHIEL